MNKATPIILTVSANTAFFLRATFISNMFTSLCLTADVCLSWTKLAKQGYLAKVTCLQLLETSKGEFESVLFLNEIKFCIDSFASLPG